MPVPQYTDAGWLLAFRRIGRAYRVAWSREEMLLALELRESGASPYAAAAGIAGYAQEFVRHRDDRVRQSAAPAEHPE